MPTGPVEKNRNMGACFPLWSQRQAQCRLRAGVETRSAPHFRQALLSWSAHRHDPHSPAHGRQFVDRRLAGPGREHRFLRAGRELFGRHGRHVCAPRRHPPGGVPPRRFGHVHGRGPCQGHRAPRHLLCHARPRRSPGHHWPAHRAPRRHAGDFVYRPGSARRYGARRFSRSGLPQHVCADVQMGGAGGRCQPHARDGEPRLSCGHGRAARPGGAGLA